MGVCCVGVVGRYVCVCVCVCEHVCMGVVCVCVWREGATGWVDG